VWRASSAGFGVLMRRVCQAVLPDALACLRRVGCRFVVTYLSDEWLDRAADALAASSELAERTAELDLTIGYVVAGTASGKVGYSIHFDHGTTSLERPGGSATVSFELDYPTAAAIAQGEVSAQAAFMQGRLKLVGDVNVMIRDGAVLDGVTDALADLRADTDF